MQDAHRDRWYKGVTGYALAQDRIVVFPWGVNLERFSPQMGKRNKGKHIHVILRPFLGTTLRGRCFSTGIRQGST